VTAEMTPKRRAKRQAIFDAAASRFAQHGYHGARMQDIADDLGLRKAALYYYFDSKEAVLVELIRDRVGLALEAVTEIARAEVSPAEKIERAVLSHLRVFNQHADLYTIFNSEKLHSVSLEAARIVDDLGRSYEERWAEMLGEGVRSVTVKAVMGMLNNTLTWFSSTGRLSIDALAERYVALIRSGVTVRPDATGDG
jgi:AcrR family transcriptional regulator